MLIDAHVHFGDWNNVKSIDSLKAKMDDEMAANEVDRFVLAVTGRFGNRLGGMKLADALWYKRQRPENVYVFGGLDWTGAVDGGAAPDTPFVDQLDLLKAAGCDGLKLLIGKPDCRKLLGHALDSDILEPIYCWLEENDWPCTWHIADPPEFWNEATTPLWARRNGWWYDESNPPKAQIDAESMRVFDRHPNAKFILAHFYFISQDLEAAAKLLDDHPGICLDLTPGVEMLHNFSKDTRAAHDFLTRYSGRILYGTDTGMDAHATGPKRAWMLRHYLETTKTFPVPDDPFMLPDDRTILTGIGLDDDSLEDIFAGTFLRLIRNAPPTPIDEARLQQLCDWLCNGAAKHGQTDTAAKRLLAELG